MLQHREVMFSKSCGNTGFRFPSIPSYTAATRDLLCIVRGKTCLLCVATDPLPLKACCIGLNDIFMQNHQHTMRAHSLFFAGNGLVLTLKLNILFSHILRTPWIAFIDPINISFRSLIPKITAMSHNYCISLVRLPRMICHIMHL
uniref:Helicase protein MOM1-like isoform X2 n=1 Tax=Rhizophora mucronata TaxID=61149 RepID=A0A2P2J664_RHIMU